MERDAPRIDPLARRIAHLRKAYARGLGHKPSTLQAAAIDRAARLTALAEQAAADPQSTSNDVVRLDGQAARARRDMAAELGAKSEPVETLQDYVRSRAKAQATA